MAVIFLIMFIINAKKGQFEDDESPAVRILLDDELRDEKQEVDADEQKTKKEKNK